MHAGDNGVGGRVAVRPLDELAHLGLAEPAEGEMVRLAGDLAERRRDPGRLPRLNGSVAAHDEDARLVHLA